MTYFKSTIFHMVIILLPCISKAQQATSPSSVFQDSTFSFIEINMFGSDKIRTPFWMHANQFGIIPDEGRSISTHAGLERHWNLSKSTLNQRAFRLGGGIEIVGNIQKNPKILLPQAFGSVRFKNWELFAGRKRQLVGLADSTIGSGSYIWSGNALPIPKIQIGTLKFVSVPFTNNWMAFNAFYSDGIFESNRPRTNDLKLHQKQLYVRFGKPRSKLRLYGGFNHQVQWGGKTEYHTVNGQMPKGFGNYVYVITGMSQPEGPNLTHFDSSNRIGNHLGSIDLAIELDVMNTSWFVYRQNIYEDGSLYHLNNIADGLNGIRFKRKASPGTIVQLTGAVVEFLHTRSQGGPDANLDYRIRGKDDYFNNAQVRDGWSYFDRTIGTPFISPTSDTKWKWPVNSDFFTSNNRVSVWHVGLTGTFLDTITWTGKISHSRNYGVYDVPFEGAPKQISAILAFQANTYLLGGTIFKGSFAADIGDLYPRTFGVSLGIRKDGLLETNSFRFRPLRY